MKIPLVDLKAQYETIKAEIDAAVGRVIDKTQFILGPEVKGFEQEVAAFTDVKYAIGVASGTDALHLSLLAGGIQPGDEVITTPFTFFATAEVITQCGAVPVFVDIDPVTYNIDPSKVEDKITGKTKAIIPVHLYGHPADMAGIMELAGRYNLKVIEDCAQAMGAKWAGKRVGSYGDAGCLSFFPSKILGAYGDGGMVVTDNPDFADKVTMLRNHGGKDKYFNYFPGFNSRLDEMQAAILRVKLKNLDKWIELRQQKAEIYARLFQKVAGAQVPEVKPNSYHCFNYYTIRLGNKVNRDALQKVLKERDIATAVYYPLSLHLQPVYKSLEYKVGDLPECERAQQKVISLPIYPEMTGEQIEYVVNAVKEAISGREAS